MKDKRKMTDYSERSGRGALRQELGAVLFEARSSERLGERVSEHLFGRAVGETDDLAVNALAHEIVLEVETLDARLADRIFSDSFGTRCVGVDGDGHCWIVQVELEEEIGQPARFLSSGGEGNELGLSSGRDDERLLLGKPGDGCATREEDDTAGGLSRGNIVRVTSI